MLQHNGVYDEDGVGGSWFGTGVMIFVVGTEDRQYHGRGFYVTNVGHISVGNDCGFIVLVCSHKKSSNIILKKHHKTPSKRSTQNTYRQSEIPHQ